MSFEQEYFLVLLLECLFQFLLLIMCLLYYFFSYQTLFCRLNLSFFPSSLQSYSSLSIGDHIYFLVLCDCVIRLLQFHLLCFSKLHSVLLIPAHLQLFQFRRVFLSFSMIFSLFFLGGRSLVLFFEVLWEMQGFFWFFWRYQDILKLPGIFKHRCRLKCYSECNWIFLKGWFESCKWMKSITIKTCIYLQFLLIEGSNQFFESTELCIKFTIWGYDRFSEIVPSKNLSRMNWFSEWL